MAFMSTPTIKLRLNKRNHVTPINSRSLSMSLSPKTIEHVKATVPVLKEHGSDIAQTFYDTLFKRHPDFKAYFNMDRHKGGVSKTDGLPSQVASLSRTVLAYASKIDDVESLLPAIESILHKHVARGIHASQYSAIGECLLYAIKEVMGEAASEETMAAWAEAYDFLAELFISAEKDVQVTLEKNAGFSGMVEMRVTFKDVQSRIIGLVPIDYNVPPYGEGQFVAIKVADTMTSMSLVEGNSDELSIKVPENEERATKLVMDSEPGDVLKVSMPCGKATVPSKIV